MTSAKNNRCYRAAWDASSDWLLERLFICPSVSLSVKRVYCDKTEERSVRICIPYERSFSLVFVRRMVSGGRPLLPEIMGQADPVGTKTSIFSRYSLVAPRYST